MNPSNMIKSTSTVRQKGFNFKLENNIQDNPEPTDGFFPMRDWQKKAFDEFKDAPLMILNAPMGSGKSWMMCFLSAFKLENDPKLRCIIAVPQTIIASGFIKEKLMMPDGEKIFWLAGHDLCSNKPDEGTIRYVIKWLGSDGNLLPDRILVCTHTTIALVYKKLYEERQLELLSNLLLWVDEAHHLTSSSPQDEQQTSINTSNALGKLVSYLFHSSSSNNQIGLATATYFRGDQHNLIPSEMEREFKRYNLPYDRYLETMTHLRSFNFDFIICGQDYTNAIEDLVQERKKDIVYIPRPNSLCSTGNKHQEVKNIISKYQEMYGEQENQENKILITLKKGNESFKILDLVDERNREQKKNYLCGKTIKEHKHDVDVIIALGMFKEGANWVWAERSIICGVRSSLVDIIQMIGRLFRDAAEKKHVEVIQLLPFSFDQNDEKAFLENLNNYLKAVYASLILENIFDPVSINIPLEDKSKNEYRNSEKKQKTNLLNTILPDAIKQQALFEDLIVEWLTIPLGVPQTEYITKSEPILEKYGINEHSEEVATQILRQLSRRSFRMKGLSVDSIDFNILQNTSPLECLLRYTSGVCDINTFQKLREAILKSRPPLTKELIITWIKKHFDKYQKYPFRSDGFIEFADDIYHGETWSRIDTALREGNRGLPGASSLAQLLTTEFGVRNIGGLSVLTIEKIEQAMQAHFDRTGEFPNEKSGPIPELPEDTWETVSAALYKSLRGLPSGLSLAKIREKFGVRNRKNLPKLDIEKIKQSAKAYYVHTGKWPNKDSGPILEMPEETWARVDDALKVGLRGLPGKSSLTKLLATEFGIRNLKKLPDLDLEVIKKSIRVHFKHTGQWPTNKSFAPIPEIPSETWSTIDSALRRAKRGLPKTSLAKLQAQLGGRNYKDLPCLSEELIVQWAQKHFDRTGAWPNERSGQILDATYETWCAVNIALRNGLRGLSGNSSLPMLLESKCGKRNPKKLPNLDLEMIKKSIQLYIERIGQCPNRDSGAILDLPGETWSAVITALTKGSRGLEKGWNITKLRKEVVNE